MSRKLCHKCRATLSAEAQPFAIPLVSRKIPRSGYRRFLVSERRYNVDTEMFAEPMFADCERIVDFSHRWLISMEE